MNENDTKWITDAMERNLEPMKGSAIFLSLFSGDIDRDALVCLQFGMALLLDKPIYLIVKKGVKVPENIRRIAKGIEFLDVDNKESTLLATTRLLEKAGLKK